MSRQKAPAPASTPSVAWLRLVVRSLLAAAVLWMAWRYIAPSTDLQPPGSSAQVAEEEASAAPELEAPIFLLADMLDGNWRFADAPWTIGVRQPALDWNQQMTPPEMVGPSDRASTDMDRGVLEALKQLGATVEDARPWTRYRLEKPEFTIVAFAGGTASGPWLRLASMTTGRGDSAKTWVLETSDNAPPPLPASVDPQPPLPEDAQTIATRHDALGRSVGRIAYWHGDLRVVSNRWRQLGWEVESSDDGQGAAHRLICRKDNIVWSAWAMPAQDASQSTLMLVRVPEL